MVAVAKLFVEAALYKSDEFRPLYPYGFSPVSRRDLDLLEALILFV